MSNSKGDEAMGGFIAFLLIAGIFGQMILAVIQALITFAIVGGIGYFLYKVERDTGGISRIFSNITDSANDAMERRSSRPKQKSMGLPQGQEDPLLSSIEKLAVSMDGLNSRMEKQDLMLAQIEENLTAKIETIVDEKLSVIKKEQLNVFFDDKTQ